MSLSGKLLSKHLEENVDEIKQRLGNSEDLIVKSMTGLQGWHGMLVYIDGLTDSTIIHHSILDFLMSENQAAVQDSAMSGSDTLHYIKETVLAAGEVTVINHYDKLFLNLLSGVAILLLEDCEECLAIAAEGWKDRNVSEPTSQGVVRGPMEAFTENIRTNTALIRRKIKDPQLWLVGRCIGSVTQTNVAVMYLNEIAEKSLVDEVFRRLDKINIDGILESGYIEEFIQESSYSPFPTVYNTERPDTIAAGLLEGKVAILVDGTPFALLVPALFVQFFQSAEDYYQRADVSTLLRLLRYVSFLITMLAPSVYIAITTFHQEMLPTGLLINLAAQREGVPFPAFVEALLMEVTFEILREAGVRMPKTVGQAVSIVGTLVIGQAAVDAGIVSAVMVIIVSITAISSFVIPAVNISISVRMIRFGLMGLAASFGLFGILMGVILLVLHLNTLKSFGVPYMQSLAPFVWEDQKDTLFRFSWKNMRTRPLGTGLRNLVRQKKAPDPTK
ncbi:spore germination protein [Paenibacillus luteus]|uniref:spore germination protein n=1 Tax=Paenibacillus luteus TaxID=2545753 RepID=UPI001143EE62|nr:spore germination protein [Paenibacillus luteus]